MARDPDIVTTGFDDLENYLSKLPQRAAQRLQNVAAANHQEHKREAIKRSRRHFSPEGRRVLSYLVRVHPSSRKPRKVKRLEDVDAATASYWKGATAKDPREGAAVRIETSLGGGTNRPKRRRFLLIPMGDLLTPTGRVRRKGGKPVMVADLPDTRVVRLRSGKRIVVQRIASGTVGQHERAAARARGAPLSRKKKDLGERERVVGVLVRQAKQFAGLDFFGSWNALKSRREQRFDRILDDIANGRPLVRGKK